jgi:dienelactone hydrolase
MLGRMKTMTSLLCLICLAANVPGISRASAAQSPRGDIMAAEHFRAETKLLSERCLTDVSSLADWEAKRGELRQQLFEMLSLSPFPDRTDLKAVVTGVAEEELFTVEKLHFQSMPGLYVTANLYLPKELEKPAPAILYVCGHAQVVKDKISYGNKTAYEHHGSWFARNGYVCLTIDTVQLGEIQGVHHGTHRAGMWWWNSRGYTPAGVEAWNCIRALDYLESRPEVDAMRLGVTGRSGGGAYSWWVAALDERIKVAAPVAGITDLENHVVDGVVEGHCDCMFMINTYRWDYPVVAALVAPRPLLICNSDKDSIFPLDGVVRVHAKVARIYKLHKAADKLGLLITEGPHRDTQDLQLPVFRWFNRHLKGEEPIIEMAAKKLFTPEQLKVFKDELPGDQRTSRIHETFVPSATHAAPKNSEDWSSLRKGWMEALEQKVFRGWPEKASPMKLRRVASAQKEELQLQSYEFTSQSGVDLRLYLLENAALTRAERVVLRILDEQEWTQWVGSAGAVFADVLKEEVAALSESDVKGGVVLPLVPSGTALAFFAPRGLGLSAFSGPERKQVQIRRRFMLLGQTLDSMRVWDIRRAIQSLGAIDSARSLPLRIDARGQMAVNALYASLFEPGIGSLLLDDLPKSHMQGPDYLNVLRFLDIPQAVALAAGNVPVVLRQTNPETWFFPAEVAANLGWPEGQFQVP